jgi:hypothetical protein
MKILIKIYSISYDPQNVFPTDDGMAGLYRFTKDALTRLG